MRGLIITNDGKRKPGSIPLGRVGVYDTRHNLRGHVAPSSSANVAARIIGKSAAVHGVERRKVGSHYEWHGRKS